MSKHTVTRYENYPTEALIKALACIRNARRRGQVLAVLRSRGVQA